MHVVTSFDPATSEAALRRFAELACTRMAQSREEIDALNVYPVPDGDTGTNMFLTVESAREEMQAHGTDLVTTWAAYARGALLGARGNSGVILSQLIGALIRHIGKAGSSGDAPKVVADALTAASDAAYAAVGVPVEGTILTVARKAAEAAQEAANDGANLAGVVTAAAEQAHEALLETPRQLAALANAGVVDAGGRGLCVLLDAVAEVLTGIRRKVRVSEIGRPAIPVPTTPGEDLTEGGPAYEVMYLLEAADEQIETLRTRLGQLGDSLVVVGGEGLWNVHVHVDDVGAAVEMGIDAGRPRRIKVTHFAEQLLKAKANREARRGRRIVAVAAGPGLADLFNEAGAVVLSGGPGHRPSTREVLGAIMATEAHEVIILPNDADSVKVCEAAAQAASDQGVRAVVVPTNAQVQGIAALAVHEPARALEADVVAMTSAARHARHGALTVAAKQAMTSAGPCEAGDVLGVFEGDFVRIGSDLTSVGQQIIDLMLSGGGELVTIVSGVQGTELADSLEDYIESAYSGVDVVRYDGGQERYPILVSVE